MATDPPIDAGALPVESEDDVRRVYPAKQRRDEKSPVQQAFVAGQLAMHRRFHDRAAYAAQQSDMLRATGHFLDEHGGGRGFHRAVGELQEDFRDRLLRAPELVSRDAIVSTINAILAPHTTATCQVSESILDRWFVHGDPLGGLGSEGWQAAPWLSFVGANPKYPDRLYPDVNGERQNSMPGGARAFGNASGRMLVIRVPDLSGLDGMRGFTRTTDEIADAGFFVTDDGAEARGTYMSRESATAMAVYNAIADALRGCKGQSVRWVMFIDGRLNEDTEATVQEEEESS